MTTAHIDPNSLTETRAADGTPTLSVAGYTKETSSASVSASSPSTSSSAKPASAPTASHDPAPTGIRQRVNKLSAELSADLDQASHHPAVKNVKGQAQAQLGQLRRLLGRSQLVVAAEKQWGVDRVILVFGGAFLYLLLVPLNIFGLGLPVTTALTFLPASLRVIQLLDSSDSVKDSQLTHYLSYFVILGFVQFAESLAAGFLARRVPQYYTLKLVLCFWLLSENYRGAETVYHSVFKPMMARARQTSAGSGSSGSSSRGREMSTPPTSKSTITPHISPTFDNSDKMGVPKESEPQSSGGASAPTLNQLGVMNKGILHQEDAIGQGFVVATEPNAEGLEKVIAGADIRVSEPTLL